MAPIYLDHNATTPLLPEAWEAMRPVTAEAFGNPSSAHHAGRKARQHLEDARERVAALLGAHPDEVVFTSGATEANNLAVLGLLDFLPSPLGGEGPGVRGKWHEDTPHPDPLPQGEREKDSGPGHLLAAPIEHPCVVEPLKQLERHGFALGWLPVTRRGHVEPAAVLDRIRADTRLVCLMLANHETGAVQPVREVALALAEDIPLHCDAAQAVGKVPVHFRDLGAATLTASAHKFRGPKGVGLLLLRRGTKLRPLFHGGHQQRGHRPGTEPVALAVGLAVALEHAVREVEANRAKLEGLRRRLLDRLRMELGAAPLPPSPLRGEGRGGGESAPTPHPNAPPQGGREPEAVVVNGPAPGEPDGLPTTLNVSFPGCRAELLLARLDLAGVACSTGSACSSGSLLPSPVLRAMGVPDEVLRSAIRFSLGPPLTESNIDEAAERIAECVTGVRGR
jgi:cysteine desulfurase